MAATIEYSILGQHHSISCELLVIACDPRHLIGVINYDRQELNLWQKLTNFAFHTTLLKVPVNERHQTHAVVFAPKPLELMGGSIYAYRNESAKQFGIETANTMDHNLITVYQILNENGIVWSPQHFADILADSIPTLPWWTYGSEYEIMDSVTTPYFNHYSGENLKAGLPWQILAQQGIYNTIYVHGSTCFESIFDCWAYGNLILNNNDNVQAALPSQHNDPIVIVGAGASGLLFAEKLKKLGYTNIKILESTDRYGGKTHTIVQHGPYPAGSTEPTVCELGACYLSPSYVPMVDELQKYFEGNQQIDFAHNIPNFRGIATEGQFPNNRLPDGREVPTVMVYDEYVTELAKSILNITSNLELDFLLAEELIKYTALHIKFMGEESPMPLTEPRDGFFFKNYLYHTFHEYLEYHDLPALKGILQYGYEVQGYGSLKSIPAYYGLIWMTPAIIETILGDKTGILSKPVVTAWSKGWGDLWRQIVQKNDLQISYNTIITSITRSI